MRAGLAGVCRFFLCVYVFVLCKLYWLLYALVRYYSRRLLKYYIMLCMHPSISVSI